MSSISVVAYGTMVYSHMLPRCLWLAPACSPAVRSAVQWLDWRQGSPHPCKVASTVLNAHSYLGAFQGDWSGEPRENIVIEQMWVKENQYLFI